MAKLRQPIKNVTWRSQVASQADQLEADLKRSETLAVPDPQGDRALAAASIATARDWAEGDARGYTRLRRWASGSDVEAAWSALHQAEAALVMVAPEDTLRARLPDLHEAAITTCQGDGRLDGYLITIDEMRKSHPPLTAADRAKLREIKVAVTSTSDAAHSNIRNYRNWLLIVSTVVIAGLLAAAIAHAANSEFIFIAERGSGGEISADLLEIEAAGALGGLMMAVFALIRLTVYAGPVALPLWQALVRIPAGAVAAVAGTALLQGAIFSSISPQSRSGVLAYAFLFGAAPEIVLRFLDNKVNAATAAARPRNDPLKASQTGKQATK